MESNRIEVVDFGLGEVEASPSLESMGRLKAEPSGAYPGTMVERIAWGAMLVAGWRRSRTRAVPGYPDPLVELKPGEATWSLAGGLDERDPAE